MTEGKLKSTVLCVTDSLSAHATAGVRGDFYRRFFESEGWTVKTVDVAGVGRHASRRARHVCLKVAQECEWVILIKVPSLSLARALRAQARAVIAFDFSDALWKRVHRRAGWADLERILGSVDTVLCENQALVPCARRYNAHVFTAPTGVPLAAFDAARVSAVPSLPFSSAPPSRPLRVGWVGSRTTVGALHKVRGPLKALAARHPEMELRVLGASESAVARALEDQEDSRSPGDPRNSKIRYSVLEKYNEKIMIREMLTLDVGMYPAPFDAEDYIARGPLKAMLYMAAGIPVICEPGGDCSRLLRDGESAMLAASPVEWEHKLEVLLVSPALRARMGHAGLEVARAAQRPEVLYGELRVALATVRRGDPTRPSSRLRDVLRSFVFRMDALAARMVRVARRMRPNSNKSRRGAR